ncbi:MAG: hypothetical protein CMC70_04710 [Flavobacteriaceae bacterium]|nr:hypothetical protein [Flavobacteriaceae bacterium]
MNVSSVLLKTMGLKFARTLANDEKLEPEEKLWRSVVVNALEDTMLLHSDRKASLDKISAHNWILKRKKDFDLVCYYGQLDPDDIMESYIKALRLQNIRFTERQVMWHVYNKVYISMENLSKDEKKIIRKRLDSIRKTVYATSTEFTSTIFVSAFV